MSSLLFRWGHWSARRPWPPIGSWLAVSVLVVAASAAFGQRLEDTMPPRPSESRPLP